MGSNACVSLAVIDRVRSLVSVGGPDDCWEWQKKGTNGYGRVKLRGEGSFLAHRVMWMSTHGPIPPGMFICHRCDNRKCCNPAHLFLGTAADNNRDMLLKGRQRGGVVRGEGHHRARFTEDQILAIRSRYKRGMGPTLAREYGTCPKQIYDVVKRKIWTHI